MIIPLSQALPGASNDHARRRYVEALKLGDRRAARVVSLYGELYAVERAAKDAGAEERLRMRRARSVPLWNELAAEVARLDQNVEPKSPLGKANTYFRRQGPALRAFLDHGVLPISNAHVERLLRTVALFRKNSLFVGSLEAGERYAALLTLAVNSALSGAIRSCTSPTCSTASLQAGPRRALPTSCRKSGSLRSRRTRRSRAKPDSA